MEIHRSQTTNRMLANELGAEGSIDLLYSELQGGLTYQVHKKLMEWLLSHRQSVLDTLTEKLEQRLKRLDSLSKAPDSTTSQMHRARVRALYDILDPGSLAADLREVAWLKEIVTTYQSTLALLEASGELGHIVRRYHLPAQHVFAISQACALPLRPVANALSNHAREMRAHFDLLRSLASKQGTRAGFALAASIAGGALLGPFGALGGRFLAQATDDSGERKERSTERIGETFEEFIAAFGEEWDAVEKRVHHLLLALYGGLLLRLEKDLNALGRSLVDVDLNEGQLQIGLSQEAHDSFVDWADTTLARLRTLSESRQWGPLGDAADKALRVTMAEPLHAHVVGSDGKTSYAVEFASLRATALDKAADVAWAQGNIDTACTIYRHLLGGSNIAWLGIANAETRKDQVGMHVGAFRLALAATRPDASRGANKDGLLDDLLLLPNFVMQFTERTVGIAEAGILPSEDLRVGEFYAAWMITSFLVEQGAALGISPSDLERALVPQTHEVLGEFVGGRWKKWTALLWTRDRARESSNEPTTASAFLTWLDETERRKERRIDIVAYSILVFLICIAVGAYVYWPADDTQAPGQNPAALVSVGGVEDVASSQPTNGGAAPDVNDPATLDLKERHRSEADNEVVGEGEGSATRIATIAVERANIRGGPGIEHDVLITLPIGTSVSVVEVKADWVQISTRSIPSGWVSSDLLQMAPDHPKETPAGRIVTVVVPHAVVRVGPGKNYEKTGTVLRQDTRLRVVSKKAGWMLVALDGKELGWVYGQLLEPQSD